MTGPCVNNDGASTVAGRLLCKECERRLMEALAMIGEDAMPLLLVATKRASVSIQGNRHSTPAQAPSPLRDGMWELYCETEQLLRQLGLRFDYAKAVDPRATVKALANAAIMDPVPLLSSGDVLGLVSGHHQSCPTDPHGGQPRQAAYSVRRLPQLWKRGVGRSRRTVRRMRWMRQQGEPSCRRRPSACQTGRQRSTRYSQATEC